MGWSSKCSPVWPEMPCFFFVLVVFSKHDRAQCLQVDWKITSEDSFWLSVSINFHPKTAKLRYVFPFLDGNLYFLNFISLFSYIQIPNSQNSDVFVPSCQCKRTSTSFRWGFQLDPSRPPGCWADGRRRWAFNATRWSFFGYFFPKTLGQRILGGGFKSCLFSPRNLGKIPILAHFFSKGFKPPTRIP